MQRKTKSKKAVFSLTESLNLNEREGEREGEGEREREREREDCLIQTKISNGLMKSLKLKQS